ncbi:MAG: BrnT family toxin [Aulosira sp. ZfuVER01]|nr:BrnT family toxin [Aulosira sp. ZfuVER01]MDZ7999613.1 BrnT family toxin [Aulosira sp. DedVER01a]MDZ8054029.1 BrnT family toxin [Aulosira sp. ZfuCHP01]
MNLEFEWDNQKDSLNLQKHGISFETAKTVFDDPLAYIFDDEWHSVGDCREIIIGHDEENRLLLVCFTERAKVIRIISARLATKKERRDYEEFTDF